VDNGAGTKTTDPNPAASAREAGKSKHFSRSKDLVGANVKNAQGQKLGDISEIYVNPQNGQTLAAIDIGSHRHAIVPLQALRVSPPASALRNAEVTLNKSKADLEGGPVIAGNAWQKLDDPSFTQNVYSHFNLQAPTAVGGTGSSGSSSTGAATQQPSGSLTPSPTQPQP